MWLHVDWHGTNICEVHANFILATGHVVLLDYPADKDREIILHKHEHQYLARHVWRCSRKIQFSFPNSSCFKLLPFYCVSCFFLPTVRVCVCIFGIMVCIRFSLLVWVTYSLLVFGEQKMVQRLQQDQNRIFCVPLSHNSTDILAAREARVVDCERSSLSSSGHHWPF